MVQKYFILIELIGWLGFSIFVLSALIIGFYYIRMMAQKHKRISIVWAVINFILFAVQVSLSVVFVWLLINPFHFTGQGKFDYETPHVFAPVAIALLIFSLLSFILCFVCQPYFGAYIKKDEIWLSFRPYNKENFEYQKSPMGHTRIKKKAKFMKVSFSLRSSTGKLLNEFLKQK